MTATDWGRVRDNLVALLEVLAWAAQGEDLHLIPDEFAALPREDQDALHRFLEGASLALLEARRGGQW